MDRNRFSSRSMPDIVDMPPPVHGVVSDMTLEEFTDDDSSHVFHPTNNALYKTPDSKREGDTTHSNGCYKTPDSKHEGDTTQSNGCYKTPDCKHEGDTTQSNGCYKTTDSKREGDTTQSNGLYKTPDSKWHDETPQNNGSTEKSQESDNPQNTTRSETDDSKQEDDDEKRRGNDRPKNNVRQNAPGIQPEHNKAAQAINQIQEQNKRVENKTPTHDTANDKSKDAGVELMDVATTEENHDVKESTANYMNNDEIQKKLKTVSNPVQNFKGSLNRAENKDPLTDDLTLDDVNSEAEEMPKERNMNRTPSGQLENNKFSDNGNGNVGQVPADGRHSYSSRESINAALDQAAENNEIVDEKTSSGFESESCSPSPAVDAPRKDNDNLPRQSDQGCAATEEDNHSDENKGGTPHNDENRGGSKQSDENGSGSKQSDENRSGAPHDDARECYSRTSVEEFSESTLDELASHTDFMKRNRNISVVSIGRSRATNPTPGIEHSVSEMCDDVISVSSTTESEKRQDTKQTTPESSAFGQLEKHAPFANARQTANQETNPANSATSTQGGHFENDRPKSEGCSVQSKQKRTKSKSLGSNPENNVEIEKENSVHSSNQDETETEERETMNTAVENGTEPQLKNEIPENRKNSKSSLHTIQAEIERPKSMNSIQIKHLRKEFSELERAKSENSLDVKNLQIDLEISENSENKNKHTRRPDSSRVSTDEQKGSENSNSCPPHTYGENERKLTNSSELSVSKHNSDPQQECASPDTSRSERDLKTENDSARNDIKSSSKKHVLSLSDAHTTTLSDQKSHVKSGTSNSDYSTDPEFKSEASFERSSKNASRSHSKSDRKSGVVVSKKIAKKAVVPSRVLLRNLNLFTDVLYETIKSKTTSQKKRRRRVTLHDFFSQVKKEMVELKTDLEQGQYNVPLKNTLYSKSVSNLTELETALRNSREASRKKEETQENEQQADAKPTKPESKESAAFDTSKSDSDGSQSDESESYSDGSESDSDGSEYSSDDYDATETEEQNKTCFEHSDTTEREDQSTESDSDGTLKDALPLKLDDVTKSRVSCGYDTDYDSSFEEMEAEKHPEHIDIPVKVAVTQTGNQTARNAQPTSNRKTRFTKLKLTKPKLNPQTGQKKERVPKQKKTKDIPDPAPLTKQEKATIHGKIRTRLRRAVEFSQRQELEAAIQDFRHEKVRDKKGDLFKGCAQLDLIKTCDSIRDAIEQRNIDRLKYAVHHCERMGYKQRLVGLIEQAQKFIESDSRVENLKRTIYDMDWKVFAEIRRYQNPHPVVHQIIKSTLLLLGQHEGQTRKWKKCQKFLSTIGPNGLFSRIRQFSVDDLAPEIVSRSRQMIEDTPEECLSEISSGLHIFYNWTKGMIEEYINRNSLSDECKPARHRRQKAIFRAVHKLGHFSAQSGTSTLTSPQQHSKLRSRVALPVLAQFAFVYKVVQQNKDENGGALESSRSLNNGGKLRKHHLTPLLDKRGKENTLSINKAHTTVGAETLYGIKLPGRENSKLSPRCTLPAIRP